jgi:hypothetical protein
MKIWNWIVEKYRTRPAEFTQAFLQSVGGSALVVFGAVKDGFDFGTIYEPEVAGALGILFGFISVTKTWLTARKLRDPQEPIAAATDGTVRPG